MTTFSELKLAEPLSRALDTLGYTEPTPIQAQAIPYLLDGRDLLGIAQTGTGKTAAFALPALDAIHRDNIDPPKRGARVLVLAPTRELVGQIYDSFTSYGRFMEHFSAAKITGGVSIKMQIKRIVGGNDVIVATPGRLIDLLDRKAITLKDVEILILDEADQMMDMGFIHALKKIVPLLPEDRQTVFCSATFPPKIKTLADRFLTNPAKVSVAPANATADRVTQSLIYATKPEKPMLLADYLLRPEVERSLVFTRTKHGADRVVKRLAQAGLPALAIHGNKSQGQRQRALDAFKQRTVDILVATDVAARGIDIPGITHVFNYEIPNVADQYIHRIGRTARAQAEGRAVAFVAPDEAPYLKDIQKLLGEKIPVEDQPSDMAARIKVIEARPKTQPVSTAPDTSRKGRGKNKSKKQGGNRDSRARKPEHEREGADRPKKQKDRRRGKPENRPENIARREAKAARNEGGSAKSDDQGYRKRQTPKDRTPRETAPDSDGQFTRKSRRPSRDKPRSGGSTTRKPAPSRSGGDNPGRGANKKPKGSALKADAAGATPRKRKAPKPHKGGNRGGAQPPKRRG